MKNKKQYVRNVEIKIYCDEFDKNGVDISEWDILKMTKEQYEKIYDFIDNEIGPKN